MSGNELDFNEKRAGVKYATNEGGNGPVWDADEEERH
jgi:hypothetical protein